MQPYYGLRVASQSYVQFKEAIVAKLSAIVEVAVLSWLPLTFNKEYTF